MSDLTLGLRIRVNADGSAEVLGQTGDNINRISNASSNASRNLRTMESAAAGLVKTIAPLVGIYELINFGDKIIKDTATVQDLDTRLHSLTATAGDYAQTLGYIDTVADAQHKKINDLSDSYTTLRNLQNSGLITSQRTKEFFEGLNDAASALGVGNDQLKQTFFGLSQSLGMLNAENFNQVMEPIPGLLQEMDKAAGLPAGGFKNLVNEGKATTAFFSDTLAKALHTFDGAAAATAQNINAQTTDMSNSWTRLIKSIEQPTSAIWGGFLTGAKNALDSIREFNEAAITVGDTNVSASNLAKGAWDVTTQIISSGWATLKEAGLGAAADTASGWIVSGDQMQSNVKFVVNDMIGLFVGLGHSVGIIFGALAINVGNTLDNATARASAAAGDVARMGVGDFSFSSSKAVVDKPLVNGFADVSKQLKQDLSTDWIGTYVASIEGAAVAHQNLTDEQKKATAEAEQSTAKNLQLAASHNAVGSAAGLSTEATKKAAAEAKKHADAIRNAIDALNDQHLKLSLSERDYELSKLAALGMSDAVQTSSIAIWDSIQALEAQKKGIDAGASAMDAERDRYDKLTMSAQQYMYTQLLLKGVSPGTAVEVVAKSSASDDIEKQQKAIDSAWKSLENYNSTIDNTKDSMGELGKVSSAVFDGALGGFSLMVGALEKMGQTIKDNVKDMEDLAKRRAEIDAIQPDASKGFTDEYIKNVKTKVAADEKWYRDVQQHEEKQLQTSLSSARQVAGAASKMFGEKTAAAQAFHGIEIALGVASMAMEAKKVAVYVASIIPKLASGAATMFAQSGWGGFAGVAAMGAVMAALGYGMMSNSGASSESPKMSSDTGTVLGDPTAKSQSIDKTYQLLRDIHAEEYATLRSIDRGIADLHSGITDVITRLYQAGGLKDFAALPGSKLTGMSGFLTSIDPINMAGFDPIGKAVLGFLFGGKQTSTVVNQGISTNPTSISSIMAGGNLSAQQFATIETKTKGGLFSSDKTSYSTQYAAIDDATQKALNSVFKSMGETMNGLADNLGMGLSDRVKNYVIPALTVDLKGLSGEDAAKKLDGVIGAALDTMSTSVFGDILGQYQQLGEGMLETTVRIVSEIAIVQDALATSGLSISRDAIAISDGLAQAAGGIKEFQKQFDAYYDKFFSNNEKQSRNNAQLNSQLGDVALSLAASREGYRQQVEAVDLSTEAGQHQYSMLLKLSDAADTYYKGVEDATNTRRSLEIDYYSAAGRAADALAAQRADEIAALQLTGDVIAVNYKRMIYAAQDAAAVAARQRALEVSYYEASGRSVDALNTRRADEIAALRLTGDAIAVNYQQMIYVAQDAAAAAQLAQQRRGLDIALMEAQGNVSAALAAKRKDEIAAMDISLRATQYMIYATQDLAAAQKSAADAANAALDKSLQRLTASVAAEKDIASKKYKDDSMALKKQLDAALKSNETQKQSASDLLNTLTSVAGKIRAALGSTVVDTAELTRQRRVSAQSVLQSALDMARSGGSLVNFTGLDHALTDIAKPSEQLFSTFLEYQRDQGRTAVVITDLADHADTQVSVAQLTLTAIGDAATAAQKNYDDQYAILTDTYNADIDRLDGILSSAKTQIDLLRGIDNSVLSLADALRGVDSAKSVAAQTTVSVPPTLPFRVNEGATPDGYQSSGGAFYDAASGLINSKTGGNYTIPFAQQWVNDTLAAGNPALVYTTAKAEGISAQSLDALMGWNAGASNAWALANKLPAFAAGGDHLGGLRLVGEDGPEIEATGPSRIFNARQTQAMLSGGQNNDELVSEIKALTAIVAKLEAKLEKIERNTGDTKDNTRDTATILGKVTMGGTELRTVVIA